jgi:hypothetical protein
MRKGCTVRPVTQCAYETVSMIPAFLRSVVAWLDGRTGGSSWNVSAFSGVPCFLFRFALFEELSGNNNLPST